MKAKATTTRFTPPKGTATAPLLYWLTVICGLGGITVLRIDEPRHIVPLWFGSIVGLALGQLIAVLRIRVWTTVVIGMMSSWIIGPGIYIALCELFGFGTDTETAIFALLPAFVCGYASLTERGGLLAFWYPAMLWMLVILDGEAPGTFAPRAYLPLVIGLGMLFVLFLRARETRRVTLWRSYSAARLATPSPNVVLRASPMSGLVQLAWTGVVGGGALLLAAWVAPNLWQKDRALHQKAAAVPTPVRYDVESAMPCCPRSWESERVREYMSVRNDRESQRFKMACAYCAPPAPVQETGPYASHFGCGVRQMDVTTTYSSFGYPYSTDDVGYNVGLNTMGYSSYYKGSGNYDYQVPAFSTPAVTPTPAYAYTPPSPVVAPPEPVRKKHVTQPTVIVGPPAVTPRTPPTPVVLPKPKPAPVAVVPRPLAPVAHDMTPPRSPAPDPGAPWGILLPLLAGVVVLPLGSRFVRRKVTLRHLARPFWRESIDQRISNHWQRMLIGLRDAGIQARVGEQPQAFAKRVAIAGMEECATILERVRHGVRVDAEDLTAMAAAATSVCKSAQKRAGTAGSVAASFRWPLV